MKTNFIFPMHFNLQLFAEGGGDGGTGAEGATGVTEGAAVSQKGVNSLANVKYGKQAEEAPAAEVKEATNNSTTADRQAKFNELMKGEYKDLFDSWAQDTVQKRLKSTRDTVDKYNELTPTIEILAKKYGIDASDIKALNKAIEEDDSYFEDEAFERGISVEQLKQIRKMERENANLRKQMQERERRENADRLYAKWTQESDAAKAVYPGFDLRAELNNPQFVSLIRNNIDVKTAYEVIHKDEIIPAAMQFAVKTAEQKLANKVIANGMRPMENGNNAQAAVEAKSDVSQLTKAQRDEIARQVAQGKRVSFG